MESVTLRTGPAAKAATDPAATAKVCGELAEIYPGADESISRPAPCKKREES